MDATVARILARAKALGMNQKDLACAICIRPQAITEWKNGTTTSYTDRMVQIAEVLHTTTDYLYGKKKDPAIVSDDEAALDQELITRLCQLTPEELQKVDAFVEGLLAAR